MCLILVAYLTDPRYRLVVAANRDEFFSRPTAAADYWKDAPGVLGGRDLEKGGTWMGVTTQGRWAAVTNYRDGSAPGPGSRSRGDLVARYLCGTTPASDYVAATSARAGEYHGFNLLAGDVHGLHYLSNHDGGAIKLAPGIYGLSNRLLDTPWPKVERGKSGLRDALAGNVGADRLTEDLLAMLADRRVADEAQLPSTGISRDWEKRLSAPFIVAPGYGTRASSVLLMDQEGEISFRERSFGEGGVLLEDRRYRFAAKPETARATG
ncbi:MAG TPA: NRDE family protein [Burkholderiales bacterium]|nr:NRDE family protein [Burkholderiales bacterium]